MSKEQDFGYAPAHIHPIELPSYFDQEKFIEGHTSLDEDTRVYLGIVVSNFRGAFLDAFPVEGGSLQEILGKYPDSMNGLLLSAFARDLTLGSLDILLRAMPSYISPEDPEYQEIFQAGLDELYALALHYSPISVAEGDNRPFELMTFDMFAREKLEQYLHIYTEIPLESADDDAIDRRIGERPAWDPYYDQDLAFDQAMMRKCGDILSSFPEIFLQVYYLQEISGYSLQETADMLNIKKSRANTIFKRARYRINEFVKGL